MGELCMVYDQGAVIMTNLKRLEQRHEAQVQSTALRECGKVSHAANC